MNGTSLLYDLLHQCPQFFNLPDQCLSDSRRCTRDSRLVDRPQEMNQLRLDSFEGPSAGIQFVGLLDEADYQVRLVECQFRHTPPPVGEFRPIPSRPILTADRHFEDVEGLHSFECNLLLGEEGEWSMGIP